MKHKLGDNITITISRKPQPTQKRSARRDLRHGAIQRIEDPTGSLKTPNIIFHDASQRWQDFGDDTHLIGNDHPLPDGVMGYVLVPIGASGELDSAKVADMAAAYRATFFNRDSVKLPPFVGIEYREVSRALPIARDAANAMGMEVKIGRRTFPFRVGQNITVAASAEKRSERALADSSPDAELIAALGKEVHESSFATGQSICRDDVVPQLWFTHAERDQRTLWRDAAIFKPKLPPNSYTLAINDNFYFEPFDLTDTDNFKVTKRLVNESTASTFGSAEVPAPKIKVNTAAKQCRVYLVPKLWRYQLSWVRQLSDQWDDSVGEANSVVQVPWSESRTLTGYISAFSSPLSLTGWETPTNASSILFPSHPSYLHAYGDTAWQRDDTSDQSFLRFMMQLSLYLSGAGVEIVAQEPHTEQPPQANRLLYQYIRSDLQAQSDAAITISQEGAPAEMLVGGIELGDDDDARYLIWRKTPRTAETDIIYSGPYDDPGYNNDFEGFTFLAPACVTKLHSAAWTGAHPANRWVWNEGGLCGDDGLWPYLMQPRWCVI